jgi:hypothetical protein
MITKINEFINELSKNSNVNTNEAKTPKVSIIYKTLI